MTDKEIIEFAFGKNQKEEIDLNLVIWKYFHYWYLFILSLIICFVAAFFYLKFTTPIYLISSKILIKEDQKGLNIAENTVFSDLDIFHIIIYY